MSGASGSADGRAELGGAGGEGPDAGGAHRAGDDAQPADRLRCAQGARRPAARAGGGGRHAPRRPARRAPGRHRPLADRTRSTARSSSPPRRPSSRRPPAEDVAAFLGSGVIRQLGPVLAGQIVAHFGADTLAVLEATPGAGARGARHRRRSAPPSSRAAGASTGRCAASSPSWPRTSSISALRPPPAGGLRAGRAGGAGGQPLPPGRRGPRPRLPGRRPAGPGAGRAPERAGAPAGGGPGHPAARRARTGHTRLDARRAGRTAAAAAAEVEPALIAAAVAQLTANGTIGATARPAAAAAARAGGPARGDRPRAPARVRAAGPGGGVRHVPPVAADGDAAAAGDAAGPRAAGAGARRGGPGLRPAASWPAARVAWRPSAVDAWLARDADGPRARPTSSGRRCAPPRSPASSS